LLGRFPLERGSVFGASACAAFYRRAAILEAGGFPGHFKAYFEDVDLSFRLRRLGFEIVHEPDSIVWHRLSASYGRRPSRRVLELQSCNEERVFWRNTRGADLARLLPRHAAVLAAKAVKRLSERTLLPWMLGRFRAVLAGPGRSSGLSVKSPCIHEDGLEKTCPESVCPPRIVASGYAQAHECV
jgi:GT2 family glycosyltransferase